MAGASWRNLEICQVEDASTLWIREVPATDCSKELLHFLEMEKQMSHHFENNPPRDPPHSSLISAGSFVAVRCPDYWARGRVEVTPQARGKVITVFLLDFGLTYEADLQAVAPLKAGEWRSVPWQAKRVALLGVVPISLQYAFIQGEMRLTYKPCKYWDDSATSYVKLLASKDPQAEFTPMKFDQEGSVCGKVKIILPQEAWQPVLPDISRNKLLPREDGLMAMDLAELLVDCKFAQPLQEEEELTKSSAIECSQTHLSARHVNLSSGIPSAPHSNSKRGTEVHTEVVPGASVSLGAVSSSSTTDTPNLSTETNTGQTEAAECGIRVESHQSASHSNTQDSDTGLQAKKKSLKFTSGFDDLPCSPLFRRLTFDHSTAKHEAVAAGQSGCFDRFSPALSIDEEEGDVAAPAHPERQEAHVSVRDGTRMTHRPNLPNLPPWASLSLVGAMHPQELAGQRHAGKDHYTPRRDCSEIDERGSVSNVSSQPITSAKSQNQGRNGLLVSHTQESKSTETPKSTTYTKESEYSSNTHFMADFIVSTDVCTPALDDAYSPEENCKVFVAGEAPVLEAVVDEDLMSAMLNSYIYNVLSLKGMKATQLQTYTWPAIIRGCSTVIVGGKSSGKTLGYVVPLLSTILDTYHHINSRLPPGIGPLMVVVSSSWQKVKCAAECVVSLLPADAPLKVVTAWGGCGSQEEMSTGKQLLGGCDILFTTAPCLMRCLVGDDTLWGGDSVGATTTLSRCCHLVVDDADLVLTSFALEVKQIMSLWGKERKKCTRPDLEMQAVLASSRWTDLLSQLTQVLLPLLDPTIIISTPSEAAIATRVRSHLHLVAEEVEALDVVMGFIAGSFSQRKSIVFVGSDGVADVLATMMKNIALYCLVVSGGVCEGRRQQLVNEWHLMQGVTMIVSKAAEKDLLRLRVSNAHVIFHTHLGSSWNAFIRRYSFLVDHFVTDVEVKSTNCEAYLILPKPTLQHTSAKVWSELKRICGVAAEEVKLHLSSVGSESPDSTIALCCHLKAYGRCFDEFSCTFRHEICASDSALNIPKSGRVTVEVVNILNASRYLVRLTEYQENPSGQRIDLSNHYQSLCSALLQYYTDSAHHEPLQFAEKGMLCAVEDNGVWSRAQVVSVNYSKALCLLNVFLIDEGRELTIKLSSALVLSSHLAAVPPLVTEVFLCWVQPWDQDREWTSQATNFVHKVFTEGKKSKFVGTITMALGYTLWLNPLTELFKVNNTYTQKKSLRGKLLTRRFGIDNPSHIKNLQHLCNTGGVSLVPEETSGLGWFEARRETLLKINTDAEDLSSDTLTNGGMDTDETTKGSECTDGGSVSTRCSELPRQGDAGKDPLSTPPEKDDSTTLMCEVLPLNTQVHVEVSEVLSTEEFYVILKDKLEELDNLEGEIDNLHDYLESCEERKSGDDSPPAFKPSAGEVCIAKFTDGRYYRGQVRGGQADGSLTIFFVDHGETVIVPLSQVHACPSVWVEYMPGQAIRCCLAHTSAWHHLDEAATRALSHLTSLTDSWKVKAVEVRGEGCGRLYVVELTDDTLDSPLELWRQLDHQHTDTEQIMSDDTQLFNASDIDDQEIAEFLLGISAVRRQETEKKEANSPQSLATTPEETEQEELIHSSSSSLCEDNSVPNIMQQSSPHTRVDKGREAKETTAVTGADDDTLKYKSVHSVSDTSNGNTDEELCILTLKDEQHKCGETGRRKDSDTQARDPDINRLVSSESHIFNMRRLGMPPLIAVEGVTPRLAPETSWSQKEETVHIGIHLVGVEQYKCRVSPTHFTFMCVLGDKFYVLDEELCHNIMADSCVVKVMGISVSITLKKAFKEKWMSLFKDRRHRPWLRGQYQDLSSEEETSESNYDNDGWREFINSNKELAGGGLPAGISDSDGTSDSDVSVDL